MAFTLTKKVDIGSFIKARIRIRSQTSGSGSDQKGPDPTGSATLPVSIEKNLTKFEVFSAKQINLLRGQFGIRKLTPNSELPIDFQLLTTGAEPGT
jgi:hypothetical protein